MGRRSMADILTGRLPGDRRRSLLRFSELMQARDLPLFSLPDLPDVRGWHVIAADRRSVGRVERLIVEMRSGQVRYLMIALDDQLERRARRVFASSVLVPVGLAHRVDDLCTILLSRVTSGMLQTSPRIPDRPITRDDEEQTLEALGLPLLPDVPSPEQYAGDHFSMAALLERPTA